MNADPAAHTDPLEEGATGTPDEPSEQDRSEIDQRAAYEAELSRISSTDMILQSAVSLLNVGGYRLGLGGTPGAPPAANRDLEQVRDAIDGVRALMGILERRIPQELGPLRDALSQLQLAYAREAQAAGAQAQPGAPAQPGTGEVREQGFPPEGAPPGEVTPRAAEQSSSAEQPGQPATEERPAGPGPAQSSGRLWVPGS